MQFRESEPSLWSTGQVKPVHTQYREYRPNSDGPGTVQTVDAPSSDSPGPIQTVYVGSLQTVLARFRQYRCPLITHRLDQLSHAGRGNESEWGGCSGAPYPHPPHPPAGGRWGVRLSPLPAQAVLPPGQVQHTRSAEHSLWKICTKQVKRRLPA